MDLHLTDRVVVVTGASKGIGMAVVRTVLEEGARVVAASRTVTPELHELAGPSLRHVAVDLMDPSSPERVIETARTAFGGVDVLVNNAGGPPPGAILPRFSFLAPSDDDWIAMLQFNLLAAVRAIRAPGDPGQHGLARAGAHALVDGPWRSGRRHRRRDRQ